MLTCVNPAVIFRMKSSGDQRHNGVAISLKWLLGLVKRFGGSNPPESRIRQEIHNLSIGDGKGEKKQYFNRNADGTTITRAAGGVATIPRSCVLVKRSAFRPESWKVMSEGVFMLVFNFFCHALRTLIRN